MLAFLGKRGKKTVGTDVAKRYREGSQMLAFLGKRRQEDGTESEKLQRSQHTTDSSAGLFLVRKGPLGTLAK